MNLFLIDFKRFFPSLLVFSVELIDSISNDTWRMKMYEFFFRSFIIVEMLCDLIPLFVVPLIQRIIKLSIQKRWKHFLATKQTNTYNARILFPLPICSRLSHPLSESRHILVVYCEHTYLYRLCLSVQRNSTRQVIHFRKERSSEVMK